MSCETFRERCCNFDPTARWRSGIEHDQQILVPHKHTPFVGTVAETSRRSGDLALIWINRNVAAV
jgi:hypothetical protein